MLILKSGEGAGTITCGIEWTAGKGVGLGRGASDEADTFGVDDGFGVGVCFAAGGCFEVGCCFGVGGGSFSAFTGCGSWKLDCPWMDCRLLGGLAGGSL